MLSGSGLLHHIPVQAVARIMAQFTSFEVGQIKAHAHHGMSGAAISRILFKPDGKFRAGKEQRSWPLLFVVGLVVGLGMPQGLACPMECPWGLPVGLFMGERPVG